ncbi:MAG: glycerophosphodiester phosphodiesterase, partial [Hyphomonadaceae bacterium]
MKLISHRLRGFAARELAIEGLRAALARGVSSVEIDTRVTADGVIVVRHDRFLSGEGGTCAIERLSFEAARARAPELERLEAFLEIAASAPADFELLLDLKGGRAPLQHLALARAHGLAARTTFVSWRPEVLQALMAAAPEQRLAFSHIAMSERGLRQALTRLATAGLSRRAFALGAGLFAPRLAAE